MYIGMSTKTILNRIAALIVITLFLCHDIVVYACPKFSNQYDTLHPNSAFDENPVNNDILNQDIPLRLENGEVERPAVYEYDEEFWRKVEKLNPGILEKVKKVIATYFDTPEERMALELDANMRLVKGVDYDFISGRSVIIILNSPVEINGILMKEIIIKGAPFKKSEAHEEYYESGEPTGERIRQLREGGGHIEYNRDGCGRLAPLRFDRKDAIFYYKAKNEYNMGRKGFKDDSCPIDILPVMNVRYIEDKAPDGGELGVVVIASPSRTVHFSNEDKNRIGHLLEILFFRLQNSLGSSDAKANIEKIYGNAGELMGACGLVLRRLHDAGYTHGNPHSGNVVVDMDTGKVHVVDLSDARLKRDMTPKQTFGYQLRDMHYATGDFIRAIDRVTSSPLAVHFYTYALRCFLIGYFGLHGFQFNLDNDFQILAQVRMLHLSLAIKYHPDNYESKLICDDDVLGIPLAHLVAKVVYETGGSRQTGGIKSVPSDEPDIYFPIDTETLLYLLHLMAFGGQEPKKDVVNMLAKAVDKYGYGREIIHRAFLDYAGQNDCNPPSWLSVPWIIDRMAQLHTEPSEGPKEVNREMEGGV